jgi:nucleolar GTP-binding protein
MNVLYDKDHYKLALGQLNTCKNLIDSIGRDYIRLMKYGDSQFRLKQLKRAALGRMCTLLKKQDGSLKYLEQVRQHMARLPSIDPATRTVILCGYPNVGKSSFMNKVTRANVDVQPYAFTTKSLFVGHTDYRYLKWQIIDTPGILDHPLEDRNTIEMQSITALAHLRACILFLVDISEHCGYSIQQQVDLFNNIKPLFSGKPLIVVMTKSDLVKYEDLSDEKKVLLDKVAADCQDLLALSNITEEGVMEVKAAACDKLLEHRVESKMQKTNKSVENILNRIHLAQPVKRDNKSRTTSIPQSVVEHLEKQKNGDAMEDDEDRPKKILEKHLEAMNGGAGVYAPDVKKKYLLKNEDWKNDIIPEIMDGKNIADFIAPDILERLDALEKEEDERMQSADVNFGAEEFRLTEEEEHLGKRISDKKIIYKQMHKLKKTSKPRLPKKYQPIDLTTLTNELKDRGVDDEILDRARSSSVKATKGRSTSRKLVDDRSRSAGNRSTSLERSRTASEKRVVAERQAHATDSILGKRKRSLSRDVSRERTGSATDKLAGIKNVKDQIKAIKLGHKKRKPMQQEARKGEGDRAVYDFKPKHLVVGKRSNGKTDRR